MAGRNARLATGLAAFALAGLAFPFFLRTSSSPIIDPSKPLPPRAIVRGPYTNSGSQDVGPDRGSRPSGQ